MSGAVRERNVNESMEAIYKAITERKVSFGEHMNAVNAFNKVHKCLMENSKDFERIGLRGKYEGEGNA